MNKKLTTIIGVLGLAAIIVIAVMAYNWLLDRTEAPDTLVAVNYEDANAGNQEAEEPEPEEPQESEELYDTEDTDSESYTPENNHSEDEPTEDEHSGDNEEPNIPQAPDFAMYDMYENVLHLSDFIGKPIVLNFWTTWCPSCVVEMPYFQQLYDEVGGEIHILKVNLRETRETVERFLADHGHNMPVYFDAGDGALEYGVSFIPITFFINTEGHVVATSQGSVNDDTLRRGLAMAGFDW